ncbi:hypothetical protein XAC29_06715 [Xanthomonas axonopodis Xac29-1]|nr:hypothetical protein XAC29_06715 [Xanthomonas axonopodis Xac29-1]
MTPPDRVQTIAVIGAGLAGLVCAQQLQAGGHAVTVFDQAQDPGWPHAPLQRRAVAMRSRSAVFHRARSCICSGRGCLDRCRDRRALAGTYRKLGRHAVAPITERADALCRCSRDARAGAYACRAVGCASVCRGARAAARPAGMARIGVARRCRASVRHGAAGRPGTECGCVSRAGRACVADDCRAGAHAACMGGDGALRCANRSRLRRAVRQCRRVTLGGAQLQQARACGCGDLAAACNGRVEPGALRCHAWARHRQPRAGACGARFADTAVLRCFFLESRQQRPRVADRLRLGRAAWHGHVWRLVGRRQGGGGMAEWNGVGPACVCRRRAAQRLRLTLCQAAQNRG